jgi:hypothetical protein
MLPSSSPSSSSPANTTATSKQSPSPCVRLVASLAVDSHARQALPQNVRGHALGRGKGLWRDGRLLAWRWQMRFRRLLLVYLLLNLVDKFRGHASPVQAWGVLVVVAIGGRWWDLRWRWWEWWSRWGRGLLVKITRVARRGGGTWRGSHDRRGGRLWGVTTVIVMRVLVFWTASTPLPVHPHVQHSPVIQLQLLPQLMRQVLQRHFQRHVPHQVRRFRGRRPVVRVSQCVAMRQHRAPWPCGAEEEATQPGRDDALVRASVMQVEHEHRHDDRDGRQRHDDRQVDAWNKPNTWRPFINSQKYKLPLELDVCNSIATIAFFKLIQTRSSYDQGSHLDRDSLYTFGCIPPALWVFFGVDIALNIALICLLHYIS